MSTWRDQNPNNIDTKTYCHTQGLRTQEFFSRVKHQTPCIYIIHIRTSVIHYIHHHTVFFCANITSLPLAVPPPLLLPVFQLQRNFPRSLLIPRQFPIFFCQTIPFQEFPGVQEFPTLPVIIIHLDPINPKASPQNQIGKMEVTPCQWQ